jgi:type I restriction-modification system DNA methylase subunit
MNPHKNNIIKLIQKVSYRHQTWQVFSDFLEMSAIAISNSVDWPQKEEREKQYMSIISRYESKEIELFPELLGELILALEDELTSGGPTDVLGEVFHGLELHNKWTGQFFTPSHICEMMGQIALGDYDSAIDERGFLTISEPCSGSGAMVLGFAKAMKQKGYNYCSQMIVTAVDVDLKCVYMTYLQLSLYNIPAVVIHGDTILAKEYSRWYTPAYIWDGWKRKQECGIVTHSKIEKQVIEIPEQLKEATVLSLIKPERHGKQNKGEQIPLIDLGDYEDKLKKNAG